MTIHANKPLWEAQCTHEQTESHIPDTNIQSVNLSA